jgi:O-antigen ligase
MRLACMISIADALTCLRYGLGLMVTLSVIICIINPGIGQERWGLNTYDITHIGLWTGVYGSKQTLGFAAAYLFYLSVMQVIHKRSLFDMAMSAIALLTLVKSGSRGAACIDALLIAALLVARSNVKLIPLLTSLILADVVLGAAQLAFFAYTGMNYIPLFGERVDVTGRTNIWLYVAQYWTTHPWLGFGINSFWSNPVIHNQFAYLHKWVIDDCHSGYLTIWIETGLVGYGLFTAMAWKIRKDITIRLVQNKLRSINLETAFGIVLLTFTTNLSETFFMRSTNLMQAFFSFMLVKLLIEYRPVARIIQHHRAVRFPGVRSLAQ